MGRGGMESRMGLWLQAGWMSARSICLASIVGVAALPLAATAAASSSANPAQSSAACNLPKLTPEQLQRLDVLGWLERMRQAISATFARRDTVIPTFIHYNIPLLLAGWAAAMVL